MTGSANAAGLYIVHSYVSLSVTEVHITRMYDARRVVIARDDIPWLFADMAANPQEAAKVWFDKAFKATQADAPVIAPRPQGWVKGTIPIARMSDLNHPEE